MVLAGDELLQIKSPLLDHERSRIELQFQSAEIQLAQARSGAGELADAARIEQEVLRLEAQLKSIQARADQLIVRAPMAGRVRELAMNARAGSWIPAKTPLLRLVDTAGPARVTAYVSQSDIARLSNEANAQFIPDQLDSSVISIRIENIDQFASDVLEHPQLASDNGGPLATRRDQNNTMRPVDALYRVSGVSLDESDNKVSALWVPQQGSLKIEAQPVSIARKLYENIVAVLLRELAF